MLNPVYWIGCLNQPKVLTQTSVYDWQRSCVTQRLEVPLCAFPLLTFENVEEDWNPPDGLEGRSTFRVFLPELRGGGTQPPARAARAQHVLKTGEP